MFHHLVAAWLTNGKEVPAHLKLSLAKLSSEHISGISLKQLDSPMMKQFRAAKEEVPDALLFFRMGDFFELFGVDALIVSDICGLTLTSRDKSTENPVPMAGAPVAGYKNALRKCIQAGFKVAVCDQIEDPKFAKGIVKRAITRIATPAVPGDLYDDDNVDVLEACYLASVVGSKNHFTFAYVDVATGDFHITAQLSESQLLQEIATISPREILVPNALYKSLADMILMQLQRPTILINPMEAWLVSSESHCRALFLEFFQEKDLNGFGILNLPQGLPAVCALLHYLKTTQKEVLQNIKHISQYSVADYLILDEATKKHLDFFYTSSGEKKGSLFHFLNRTTTATGSRALLRRLNYPFKHAHDVEKALGFVKEMVCSPSLLVELVEVLRQTSDIDRLLSRAAQKNLDARGMVLLKNTLFTLPTLLCTLRNREGAERLSQLVKENLACSLLLPLAELLQRALLDEPAVQLGKGGAIFKEGYHTELDEVVALENNFSEKLDELERFERERSQISNLKIGYTRVFGYYFEISKGKLAQVPEHFMRKQTLVNGERFITAELKELEEKALGAADRRLALERDLLEELRLKILDESKELTQASQLIAQVDLFATFAQLAEEHGWSQPTLLENSATRLVRCTHPILAQVRGGTEPFIDNDITLDAASIHLITGPNMAGKSTLMRQVAMVQVLCQMGSFVPAEAAEIGLADRILTRIGSADHALKNQSTFMVEMLETATILRLATPQSLLLFDEVGRGTSTFDGLSLAWAILENLHDNVRARTLFSTHYHELNEVCATKTRLVPMQMAVVESETAQPDGSSLKTILFSRKYVPGSAHKSYGLHVAELAGIPRGIIVRAEAILARLEQDKKAAQREDAPLPPLGRAPLNAPKRKPRVPEGLPTLF